MALGKHYLSIGAASFMAEKITQTASREDMVNQFWQNILLLYFKQDDGCLMAFERYPEDGVRKVPGLHVFRFEGNRRVVLVCADGKAHDLAGNSEEWNESVKKTEKYVAKIRQAGGGKVRPKVYFLVNIGLHTRFYEIPSDSELAHRVDIADQVEPYNIIEDEDKVHGILTELANRVKIGH